MASSVVGALRVDLGLNSAQFTAGLTKATGALKKFGIQTTLSLETVATQIGRIVGAIPRAVRASIDHADALAKSAQKAGVTVEALSRLEYAAKLSDVSLEGLTGGLQKLGKSMADVAAGNGPQTAFAALGIAVKDASGGLRDTDAVLADLADRFSRIEDGATKTALAIAILGKSGAELIPLLNEGADGFKRMAAESDRTGNTISTKTAQSAEKFNDTLTRLSGLLKGVINQLMEAVLPTLQAVADAFMQVDPQVLSVATGIGAVTVAATLAAPAIGTLTAAMKGLYATLALIAALPAGVLALATGFYLGSTSPVGAGEDALVKQLGLTNLPTGSAFNGGWGSKPVNDITVHGGNAANDNGIDLSKFTADLGAAAEAQKKLNAEQQMWQNLTNELAPLLEATNDPLRQLQTDLDKLGAWLQHEGAGGWDAYAAAVTRAKANAVSSMAGMASQITGILGQMFEDNKAIAVANAVVNGIEGVSKALSAYPPPFSFIMAGLQGAAAALQVGNILSTNKNSKSMPGSSTSPGGGGGAAATAGQAQQQSSTVILRGHYFDGESVAELITQLIKDGGGSGLVNVIRERAA